MEWLAGDALLAQIAPNKYASSSVPRSQALPFQEAVKFALEAWIENTVQLCFCTAVEQRIHARNRVLHGAVVEF